MKKHFLLNINVLVAIIIITGTVCMTLVNFYTYSNMIKSDIQHISTLTSSNIFSEISGDMTKPIFVSLTMANDTFLKQWMENERNGMDNAAAREELRSYLMGYKKKYNYNSVFLVSSSTEHYYHFKGLHKTISPENRHDVWYYNFLKENKAYSLIIDRDEADRHALTVFVNCRVENARGELLGVVGVGVKIQWIQNTLRAYRDTYGVRACLVDGNGVVQAHAEEAYIGKYNIFTDIPQLLQQSLLQKDTRWNTAWQEYAGQEAFIVSRYIPEMNWFLVVEHDTVHLRTVFMHTVLRNTAITAVILVLLLTLSTTLIARWRCAMNCLATCDELTGLPNRRAFDEALADAFKNCAQMWEKERQNQDQKVRDAQYAGEERRGQARERLYVFIFDIDHFKTINDTLGHVIGDMALKRVGQAAQRTMGSAGIVARWGGDEFIGYIRGTREQCLALTQGLVEEIARALLLPEAPQTPLTISLGMTSAGRNDTLDSLVRRADIALYAAKKQGRNRMVFEE